MSLSAACDLYKENRAFFQSAERCSKAKILRGHDLKTLEKSLGKLSLAELQKFREYGETKQEIAKKLSEIAKTVRHNITYFLEHGGVLQAVVPIHVWKILKDARVVGDYNERR